MWILTLNTVELIFVLEKVSYIDTLSCFELFNIIAFFKCCL